MFSVNFRGVPEQVADLRPQPCHAFKKTIAASSYTDGSDVMYVGEFGYVAALHIAYDQNVPFCLSDTVVETLLRQSVANFHHVNARKLAALGVPALEPMDNVDTKMPTDQVVNTLAERARLEADELYERAGSKICRQKGIPRLYIKGTRWHELIKYVEAQKHVPEEWVAQVVATLTKIAQRDSSNSDFWKRFFTEDTQNSWALDFFMLDSSNRLMARKRPSEIRVQSQMSGTAPLAAGVCVVRQTPNNAVEPEIAWFRFEQPEPATKPELIAEPIAEPIAKPIAEPIAKSIDKERLQFLSGENNLVLGDNKPRRGWPASPLFDWRKDTDPEPCMLFSLERQSRKEPVPIVAQGEGVAFKDTPEPSNTFSDGRPITPNTDYIAKSTADAQCAGHISRPPLVDYVASLIAPASIPSTVTPCRSSCCSPAVTPAANLPAANRALLRNRIAPLVSGNDGV